MGKALGVRKSLMCRQPFVHLTAHAVIDQIKALIVTGRAKGFEFESNDSLKPHVCSLCDRDS